MQLFLDTANIQEIKELESSGLIDGITTNPTLIAKSGKNFHEVIREICGAINGPVSAEVISINSSGMIKEGRDLRKIAENVVVKLPLTWEGLIACRVLSQEGIKTNVTLCFSLNQALLAAKAGATYISPFIGRLDDIGQNGMQLIADIVKAYSNYPDLKTKVLAASVRTLDHINQAALIGCHVATISPSLMKEMVLHELTDIGLKKFLDDWSKYEPI